MELCLEKKRQWARGIENNEWKMKENKKGKKEGQEERGVKN